MIRLTSLTKDHMADVLRIQKDCYTDIEPESAESLLAKIVASPATCLIAESSEGVIGYLIAVPIIYPHLPALNSPTFTLSAGADTLYIHNLLCLTLSDQYARRCRDRIFHHTARQK